MGRGGPGAEMQALPEPGGLSLVSGRFALGIQGLKPWRRSTRNAVGQSIGLGPSVLPCTPQ